MYIRVQVLSPSIKWICYKQRAHQNIPYIFEYPRSIGKHPFYLTLLTTSYRADSFLSMQIPPPFLSISIRSHSWLSLPQVSLLLLLLLPSPISSPATECLSASLFSPCLWFPDPKQSHLQVREISVYLFAYLANNGDTTLSNRKTRMVWAVPQVVSL